MKAVEQILHLDYLAIRPYFTLKNLLIFSLLFAFYAIIFGEVQIVVNMIPILAAFHVSYPFLVADDAGLDNLYTVFGIGKKSVVQGRYLTLLCLNLAAMIFAVLLYSLLKIIFSEPIDWQASLTGVSMSAAASIVFSCIQLPFLFKFGYKKAKQIVFMTFMGMWIALYFVINFIGHGPMLDWLLNLSQGQLILLGSGVFLIIFYTSYHLSLWNYQHKDV